MDVPDVQFTQTPDGVTVGYQVWGDRDTNIVHLSTAPLSLDGRWPAVGRMWEYCGALGRNAALDYRGMGASDAVPFERLADLDDWVVDTIAVMDACEMETCVAFADQAGAFVALALAARVPERVDRLWLWNPLEPMDPERGASAAAYVAEHWGTGRGLRRHYADTAAAAQAQRSAAPRNVAVEICRRIAAMDISEHARSVDAPAVVAFTGEAALATVEGSKALAATMPNAEFVDQSGNVEGWVPVEAQTMEMFERFVAGKTVDPDQQRLKTIVMTDVVGSTAGAAAQGDRRWKRVLDALDDMTRTVVQRHGGEVVKGTGDGHLMLMDSPADAIATARDLVAGGRSLNVELRVGAHTGIVLERRGDVTGIAVHAAARVMDAAGPGEVWASRTVADLLMGSGVEFTDRGTHELKGVPGEWQLFEVV